MLMTVHRPQYVAFHSVTVSGDTPPSFDTVNIGVREDNAPTDTAQHPVLEAVTATPANIADQLNNDEYIRTPSVTTEQNNALEDGHRDDIIFVADRLQ